MKLQYLFLPLLLWTVVGFFVIYISPVNIFIILLGIFFLNASIGFTLQLLIPRTYAVLIPLVLGLVMLSMALGAVSLVNMALIVGIGILTWAII